MGIAVELLKSKPTVAARAQAFGTIIGQPFEAVPAENGSAANYERAERLNVAAFVDSSEALAGIARVYFMPVCSLLEVSQLCGLVAHEVAHCVAPAHPVTHANWPAHLAHHNPQWLRAAMHFHIRGQAAGFDIATESIVIAGTLPSVGDATAFYDLLRDELLDTAHSEPIQQVLARPAPAKFVRLWEIGTGLEVSASVAPAPQSVAPRQEQRRATNAAATPTKPQTIHYVNFCGDESGKSDQPAYRYGFM